MTRHEPAHVTSAQISTKTRNVMLAAGGTGGHLFPAFALAEELKRRGIVVDLITDLRGDRYGDDFPAREVYRVPSATLAAKTPLAAAKTTWTLSRGLAHAMAVMRRVKPQAVIGFGGYPTFPPLLAAKLSGIPTGLHEQNAVLGRANRMLARRVNAIATSFERTSLLNGNMIGKARYTGNPVRDIVIAASARPFNVPRPGDRFELLVFGGSQGARFFADAVPPAIVSLADDVRGRIHVTQQARDEDLARVRDAYGAAGITATVEPFFKDLPERMAAAHLVIGRAGASTVAELTVIGRPSILVPLPHALDNDQLQNATRLAEAGGGWAIAQRDLSVERLRGEIERLARDQAALEVAAQAAKSQGRPDAVIRLADLAEDLMSRRA
jgi:UDP-N-acetylglucosamine--N-acetylmuramyl-(pentapeptide) pyrophosphoryl-undecaprenol N-acetylglucosamine transferase